MRFSQIRQFSCYSVLVKYLKQILGRICGLQRKIIGGETMSAVPYSFQGHRLGGR